LLPWGILGLRQNKVMLFCMQAIVDIPHKPSLTLEDGIFLGLKPTFVQWYIPLEQADVPEWKYTKIVR